jgi:hypothetical protein
MLLKQLAGRPKAKVEILYDELDAGSFSFSQQIQRWLGPGNNNDGAGWEVTDFRQFCDHDTLPGLIKGNAPLTVRATAGWELCIIGKIMPTKSSDPFGILSDALTLAAQCPAIMLSDTRLPEGLIRLLIGQKL